MFISVVIPTYNKCEVLLKTLQPLQTQSLYREHYEIIVVNNNSTDNTERSVKAIIEVFETIRYVFEPRQSRGAARNAGIRAAKGEIILFLDDDIIVEHDHLERHLSYFDGKPLALMGQVMDISKYPLGFGRYMHEKQFAGSGHGGWTNIDWENLPGLNVVTLNLSVSRSTLELIAIPNLHDGHISYFDESLLSRQDADLGIRLEQKGVRIKMAIDIWSKHNHPRDLRGLQERSQRSGYWAYIMMQKYPNIASPPKHIVPLFFAYTALAFAVCVSPLALVLFPIYRLPFYKCIGIWFSFETNRGYWRAERELKIADD